MKKINYNILGLHGYIYFSKLINECILLNVNYLNKVDFKINVYEKNVFRSYLNKT